MGTALVAGELAAALSGPRILTLDIERLPGRVELEMWHPRDFQRLNYVHPDKWSQLPTTVCLSYKWYDEKQVGFIAAWEDPDDPFYVARQAWLLIDEADWVVTFNGVNFDLKILRQDWAVADLPMPTPWRNIDLFQVARREFAFESKSLKHLCDRLGLPNKAGHYDSKVAQAAADGDEAARKKLIRYSKQDSRITELVFDRLRPYVRGINWGLYQANDTRCCTNCGSEDLEPAGYAAVAVVRYAAYRCTQCGSVMRNNHRSAAVPMRGVVR